MANLQLGEGIMSLREFKNWKLKYLHWYRVIEQVFGNSVPHLSDDEIPRYVSERDWMIIPLSGEADKNKAKSARRPNLYISLSEEDLVTFGIAYEKLESVNSLRNIILPYNEIERNELVRKLSALDDSFVTTVNKKMKMHHPQESPNYESILEIKSSLMNLDQFIKVFEAVDKILAERELLDDKKKYQLAPTVSLVNGESVLDEQSFIKVLSEIRPIYEMVVKMRSKEDFNVCNGCLCFTCYDKQPDCKCPCPSFPKPLGKVIECYKKDQ